MVMKIDAIIINENDNVATALRDLNLQEEVTVGWGAKIGKIAIKEKIAYGHKFAVKDIAINEEVIKYGEVIGRATQMIKSGTHAHIHNIESLRGRGDWERSETE
jgi:altronate dehydratase small subunit